MTQSKSQFKALKALHRLTVSALITLMIAQPVLAQSQPIVVHPDATGGAHIVAAPNGVSVVNIATPNARGLSHNTYEQFNVTPQGAILNNQAGVFSQTQLGGVVIGNPNLTSAPARVILNEVVSGNSSTLAGVVEVAGQSADVIIANPNGITCNGCGFIHTPRVTLTTGTPDIDGGNLDGFTVNQGEVAFGSDGANLGTVSLFDIVSRQATFDGAVTGQEVRIAVGRTSFDYATGTVTALADDGSSAPAYSIDSTAVGGLYADRIALISTEQGVAVRAPAEMSATAGAMSVTADGRLVIGQAQARGPVTVSSAQSTVQIETSLFSDNSVTLEGVSAQLSDDATLAATGNLTIDAETITLGSGAIVAAGMDMAGDLTGSGELSITTETLTGTSARVASATNAEITADQIALSGVNTEVLTIGGDLTVQTPDFDLSGGTGQVGGNFSLTSPAALELTGGEIGVGALLALQSVGALTNSTDFQVQGTASFTAGGALQNTGDVTATGAVTFDVDGNLVNAGNVRSSATIDLDSTGDFANTGSFNAAQRLDVAAANIDNQGSIGSADAELAMATPGDIINTGLLYGGTDIALALDGTLTNTDADILAEQGITITGHTQPEAAAVINRSANIEAILGSILIEARSVENSQPTPPVTTVVTTQSRPATAAEFAATGHPTKDRDRTTHTVVTTRLLYVSATDAPARILAGSDIQIDATNAITNTYSQIAANGDVTLNARTVTNSGQDLTEIVETTITSYYSKEYCDSGIGPICFDWDTEYWIRADTDTKTENIGTVFASIEAGGVLDANVSGFVTNESIRNGVEEQIGLSSGGRALATPPSVGTVNPDVILNRQALFQPTNEPNAPFFIETNPDFIDVSRFLSSDYFLDQIDGLDRDTLERRFGDAYVEARLVQEQLFALTGQRFATNPEDLRALMASLYDNAVEAAQRLQLTPGIALSSEQVAALTQSIIWLEERVIDGQVALVPVVYLGADDLDEVQLSSAQLIAQRIDIDAGGVTNSGRIDAEDEIQIASVGDVINIGGQIDAGSDINIITDGIFANISGQILGDTVTIEAESVENSTVIARDQNRFGFSDRAMATATIEARESLVIVADTDIISEGGQFIADENVTLDAGRDIFIQSAVRETQFRQDFEDGYVSNYTRTHDLAAIEAGGSVSLDAGRDLTLEGVALEAGEDALLQAERDVTIAAVQDATSSDFELDIEGSGLFGADSYQRQQSQSVETRETTLDVGGDLEIRSDTGDVELSALDIESGGQTVISAEQGSLSILTTEDSRFERQEERGENLLWWNESDEGFSETTRTLTRIEAGGGLQIIVGEEIIAEYVPTGDFTTGIAQLAQNPGLEWMAQLQEMDNVTWQQAQVSFEEWDYQSQGLTEAGALLVSVIVAAVAGPGIDILVSGVLSGMAAGSAVHAALGAALEAGLTSLATQTSISLINNQGDLGAVLSELGSADSLRGLVTAMVSAGLTSGITTGLGNAGLLNQLNETASLAEVTAQRLQVNLIRASVNASVDVAINGGDLGGSLVDGWTNAMVMTGLGAVQERIGDFAFANGISEGSIGHILAHALAGGLAAELAGEDFADGAIGAAASAAVSTLIGQSGLSEASQIRLQRLIGTAAVLLANGGNADGAGLGGNIAASAHENNYLNHEEALAREREREACSHGNAGACQRAAAWDVLDAERDTQLRSACLADIGGNACQGAMRAMTQAALSYHVDPPSQYDDQEIYVAALGGAVGGMLTEYNQINGMLRILSQDAELGSVANLVIREHLVETQGAVERGLAGVAAGGADTIRALHELAAVLVNDPGALGDAVQAIVDDPLLVPEAIWEPFSERIEAGDYAGAGGYAIIGALDVLLGSKGAAPAVRAGLDGASSILEFLRGAANRTGLVDDLVAGGANITPDEVVTIFRTNDGRTVWLETGNSSSGLQHITERHSSQFQQWGIQEADIPDFVQQAITGGNRVGTNNGAPVYLVGDTPLTVVVGDNGYVVTAYPSTDFDRF